MGLQVSAIHEPCLSAELYVSAVVSCGQAHPAHPESHVRQLDGAVRRALWPWGLGQAAGSGRGVALKVAPPGMSGHRVSPGLLADGPKPTMCTAVSHCSLVGHSLIQAPDLSCIVLFGACIEGVVLRDKYVGLWSLRGNSGRTQILPALRQRPSVWLGCPGGPRLPSRRLLAGPGVGPWITD